MKHVYQIGIRLSEAEYQRINRLAAHYGLNAQETVRMLTKREDDQLRVARSTP